MLLNMCDKSSFIQEDLSTDITVKYISWGFFCSNRTISTWFISSSFFTLICIPKSTTDSYHNSEYLIPTSKGHKFFSVHVIMAYRVAGQLHAFLTSTLVGSGQIHFWGSKPQYPMSNRLGRPTTASLYVLDKKNMCHCQEPKHNSLVTQPKHSHYNDYLI